MKHDDQTVNEILCLLLTPYPREQRAEICRAVLERIEYDPCQSSRRQCQTGETLRFSVWVER